jgi:hypothetical protein
MSVIAAQYVQQDWRYYGITINGDPHKAATICGHKKSGAISSSRLIL